MIPNNFELSATIMANSSPDHNTSATQNDRTRITFPTATVHTIKFIAKAKWKSEFITKKDVLPDVKPPRTVYRSIAVLVKIKICWFTFVDSTIYDHMWFNRIIRSSQASYGKFRQFSSFLSFFGTLTCPRQISGTAVHNFVKLGGVIGICF